jgi:phage tail sheath protein FI
MPIAPTYPGVYIQEEKSGVNTITGVSTSTALFVGSCADGPLDTPVQCLKYGDFTSAFSDDASVSEMPLQVQMFFLNGGSNAYIMRIANGAKQAQVTIAREDKSPSLVLTAIGAGLKGNQIRAAVTYDTDQPEATFNLELFRWDTSPSGEPAKAKTELWRNLSMNPAAANYAPAFLTQNSALVKAEPAVAVAPNAAYSQGGRPIDMAGGTFQAAWDGIVSASSHQFEISVGASRYVTVTLPLAGVTTEATMTAAMKLAIQNALSPLPGNLGPKMDVVTVAAPPAHIGTPDSAKWIQVRCTDLDVFIRPSLTNDVAVALMLGTAQGGLEVGAFSAARPAPTGRTIMPSAVVGNNATTALAGVSPADVLTLTLDSSVIKFSTVAPKGLRTGTTTDAAYIDAYATTANGHNDGLREKLALIAAYVTDFAASNPTFAWTARVWGYRLSFVRRDGDDNAVAAGSAFDAWAPAATMLDDNVRLYSLGASGSGAYQTAGAAGIDGVAPKTSDYADAYLIADREIDVFNLLILPPANGVAQQPLWGAASAFCLQRRAFLLMDAPQWSSAQAAAAQVETLRIGLVKDHAALYYPRLTVDLDGLPVQIGPAGAIAGLMARTDSARGVWKAPAGLDADIRGVSGLERRFSDGENGELNPKAINTLRVFPSGVVCWGARTMDGDDSTPSDYKYVPVRRLGLFLEESLYRGLRWVVFEPNDEPLWGQIRLNVGAFMHGLFLQGAFQGQKSTDAYFVRCDSQTTTQDDRNKGIVNVWVGFAPLKPAEFVILHLQQMAGQIAV